MVFLTQREMSKSSCALDACGTILTKVGGGSPGQNLTFLKNTSLVYRPKSNLTTLIQTHMS